MKPEHEARLKEYDELIDKMEEELQDVEARKFDFMRQLVADELNKLGQDPVEEATCPETWECEKSPIGTCVYDDIEDPAHDCCLFCEDPEEHK